MSESIFIVIPVYNEATAIGQVVEDIRTSGYENIIVVDDGSTDGTIDVLRTLPVTALRHRINRGKGAAVKTGIVAANRLGAEVIVTMDGDGQHDPEDIGRLIKPIVSDGFDVSLGTRLLDSTGMPKIKIIANSIGNLVTLLLYGIKVTDSQSGFRAYSRYAAQAIDTKADKYEYDSKVIREINKKGLEYVEVPIKVRYTDYSKGKAQKQGLINGLKTVIRMIWDMVA